MAGFLAAAGLIGGTASAAGHGLADSHKRAGDVGGADVIFQTATADDVFCLEHHCGFHFRRVASRNRLEASVAPSLAGIKIPHIDQSQESDAKFLTRLAERNGGEVSVKMGKLLFLKAGQGVTASGKKIPQVTITRSDGDRHHFAIADRGAYTGVTAKWLDEQDWTITKVTHFLNNSGFTTSLELEVRLSDVEYETEDDE